MKYAIVIPDGCADEPQESLGGKTPLQAAHTPHMDRMAQTGVVGLTNNVPPGLTPASDVATLSLFGYDPLEVYTGRSPLEAAAMGIQLGPNDWAIRCNLVTVENEEMRDFTAGHISQRGRPAADRSRFAGWCGPTIAWNSSPASAIATVWFIARSGSAPFSTETKTQPPHDIPDRPIAGYLPSGPGSDLLRSLMERSREVFRDHPVNRARREAGKRPATQIWLWGQGRAPRIRPFAEVYHQRGAIISGVDLVRGVGILLGWKRHRHSRRHRLPRQRLRRPGPRHHRCTEGFRHCLRSRRSAGRGFPRRQG